MEKVGEIRGIKIYVTYGRIEICSEEHDSL